MRLHGDPARSSVNSPDAASNGLLARRRDPQLIRFGRFNRRYDTCDQADHAQERRETLKSHALFLMKARSALVSALPEARRMPRVATVHKKTCLSAGSLSFG